MRFNAATRTRLLIDVTCDIDPTGSTVEVKLDDTWYPAAWQGSPVAGVVRQSGGTTRDVWTQTARTVSYFAGPDATPAAAVVLPRGRHMTKARITQGADVLVAESSAIDVR